MGERFVRIGHAMRVFAFFDGCAAILGGVDDSCARRIAMLFSERGARRVDSQRIASVSRRAARTSTGT